MAKKRKRSKSGIKHPLIFIKHSMNRIWRNLMFADLILWIAWWAAPYTPGPFAPPNDFYLMFGGIMLLFVMLIFFLMRRLGYVQARQDYVLLSLPLYKLKIPYKNIENVRMALFGDTIKSEDLKWSDRRFLRPYRNDTISVLFLKSYPKAEGLLRLMIPRYLFIPKEKGFIFLLKDFLIFNTEVDSRLNAARGMAAATPALIADAQDENYDGIFDMFDKT